MGWLSVGLKLLPFIVEAVNWVEKFITAKGKYKQEKLLHLLQMQKLLKLLLNKSKQQLQHLQKKQL